MGRVTFSLFNREFQFISEKDDDSKLKELAEKFEQKLEEIKNETNEIDFIKLLVYLSINLFNENLKLKEQIAKNDNVEQENIILQIIDDIKKVINK